MAEREFAMLCEWGLAVAHTEWHVTQLNVCDSFKLNRRSKILTLARVAVINETNMQDVTDESTLNAFYGALNSRNRCLPLDTSKRLADIGHPRQYLFGCPRDNSLNQGQPSQVTLVDIEPVFRAP